MIRSSTKLQTLRIEAQKARRGSVSSNWIPTEVRLICLVVSYASYLSKDETTFLFFSLPDVARLPKVVRLGTQKRYAGTYLTWYPIPVSVKDLPAVAAPEIAKTRVLTNQPHAAPKSKYPVPVAETVSFQQLVLLPPRFISHKVPTYHRASINLKTGYERF